jgi:hypothetical protein
MEIVVGPVLAVGISNSVTLPSVSNPDWASAKPASVNAAARENAVRIVPV